MARNHDKRPLVFLDTNVLMHYLRGHSPESQLLSDPMRRRFRFAVNPVVLSELLLAGDAQSHAEKLENLQKSLSILPINQTELLMLSDKLREVRNKAVHSNDLLIYSSAADCDYLVTQDKGFEDLADSEKPVILTPEQFLQQAEFS